jgi:HSP20 family protein
LLVQSTEAPKHRSTEAPTHRNLVIILQPQEKIMAAHLTRFEPRSSLASFNPMRDLASAFDLFDIMRPLRMLDNALIPLDVTETDQAYLVKAEIPGVKREDIKVSIQGDQVTISAQTQAETERTEGNIVCRERYHGKQFRSFTLPQSVDEENAHATCNNGVLELQLPKKGGAGAKQLSIQ